MSADRARITVLVTHRLANIRHADRILVLTNGRITEQGTHADLMAARGTYHELFTIQADSYARAAGRLSRVEPSGIRARVRLQTNVGKW